MTTSDLARYTILVVDDEEILRQAIAFDFKRRGFKVLEADSGKTAFDLVKANSVHLVISDIRMPGGDGITLLEQIRQYNPDLPMVILMTGFAEVTEEECISKGAKKIVVKPFDRKKLIESVFESLGVAKT